MVPWPDLISTTRGAGNDCEAAAFLTKLATLALSASDKMMCSFLICVTALASWEGSRDAEPHDRIAVVGRIAFSGGRSQQPHRKHPRAAAINSEAIALAVLRLGVARRGLVRARVGGNAGVAVVVTVLGPLPNVPCHVVKAECVRRLRAHRMCLAMVAKKTLTLFSSRSWH